MNRFFAVLIAVMLLAPGSMVWACADSEPSPPPPQQEYVPTEYTGPPVIAQAQPTGVPVAVAGLGAGAAFVLGGLAASLALRRLR